MKIFFMLLLLLLGNAAYAQTKNITIAPGLKAVVLHAEGSSVAKVLIAGMDTLELDLSETAAPLRAIRSADYNFDGYKDLAFSVSAGPHPVFDLFLFDPDSRSFEPLEFPEGNRCESIVNVRVLAAEKGIVVDCKVNGRRASDVYRWDTPFSLSYLRSTGADPDRDPKAEPMPKDDEE